MKQFTGYTEKSIADAKYSSMDFSPRRYLDETTSHYGEWRYFLRGKEIPKDVAVKSFYK